MKKIIATVLAMVMALALCTTAFAADDKYDLYLADSGMADQMKTKTVGDDGIGDKTIDEVAAKTNSDGSGNVAYLILDKDGTAQYAVKTTSPTVSSYAVCKKGETTILYYVNVVANAQAGSFGYKESVKAFTNWGVKCGQIDNSSYSAADKANDFFTAANGHVYMAGDATTSAATNYLLNGEVVSGTDKGAPIAHNFVANNFKYDTATGANIPTSAICTKCLTTSTAIYKDGKSPAGATVAELYVNGAASAWEVAVTGGTTPVTPDNGKDSPKTFDAGIAMYVGMALTSVAGSAVVIGKKKEF